MKEFFNYLIDKQITVATAESCTGGNIAAAFVAHPGISSVFLAGLVTYANSAKKHVLGVEDTILKRNGAVSAECAAAMLKGAIRVTGAQAAVCTTGIAGPGMEEKDTLKEKEKALQLALTGIEKQFGKGSIMKLGDAAAKINVQVIPTGFVQIDAALGVGGIPKGRITEIYGPESSGKTTLTLHIIAQAQKNGGIAAFIDAEHALDPVYAKALGVNIDELYVSQPDTGEQALDICEALARSNAVDLIVIDSVAALTPKAEIEGDMEASTVGLQARLMSRALRKITGVVGKSNTAVIFINQLRDKIGVIYGNPETTTGGKALKFFASVRIDIRKGEALKNGAEQIGNKAKIKIVKNKVAPPFKTAEVDMIFGKGISKESSLLEFAIDTGIITKSGSWFSYEGERIGQGRDNAKEFLISHPEVMEQVESKLKESLASMASGASGKDDLDGDD